MEKIMKSIAMILLMIAIISIILYKDRILTFARTLEMTEITEGDYLKNGDTIPLSSSYCSENSLFQSYSDSEGNSWSGCGYSVILSYYNEDNRFLASESYIVGELDDSDYIVPGYIYDTPVVNNDYSLFWKVTSIYYDSTYQGLYFDLVPLEYTEPVFNVSCNPTKINFGETSICSLVASRAFLFDTIDFELESEDYNISLEEAGPNFMNLRKVGARYYIQAKENLNTPNSVEDITLLQFSLSPKENKEVYASDNVRVLNINYVDSYYEDNVDRLVYTVNQEYHEEVPSGNSDTDNNSDENINANDDNNKPSNKPSEIIEENKDSSKDIEEEKSKTDTKDVKNPNTETKNITIQLFAVVLLALILYLFIKEGKLLKKYVMKEE